MKASGRGEDRPPQPTLPINRRSTETGFEWLLASRWRRRGDLDTRRATSAFHDEPLCGPGDDGGESGLRAGG